jgi:hypothetical protein
MGEGGSLAAAGKECWLDKPQKIGNGLRDTAVFIGG